MKKSELLGQIATDWGENTRQYQVCRDVVDYVMAHADAVHLTNGILRRALRLKSDDDILIQVVQYLTGERAHLLDLHFEFIEDDSAQDPPELDVSDIRYAYRLGFLVHPLKGTEVYDYKSKVFLFYRPSKLARALQI